jgi:centromeric protein E
MDEGDNINVAIRVRPLNRKEREGDVPEGWHIHDNSIAALHPASGKILGTPFLFDHVYDPYTATVQVYNEVADRIVHSVMDGINGTIFAYGQTSSGKTHTMCGNKLEPGLIPMAVRNIFNIIQQTPEREFLLRVSYMEIYNEVITDLLQPNSTNLKVCCR